MYGYSYEPIWGVTYENGSGRWSDAKPFQIQSDLYTDTRGFGSSPTPRLIGKASDYGFQARGTTWSSSKINRVISPLWPNVDHSREFRVQYRRTKTTPSHSDSSIANHQYKDGNTYWTQPNRTNRVTIIGTQDYLGNKIRLDDYVRRNVLRLSNGSADIRAHISDDNGFAYMNNSFKDTSIMTVGRYSNTHLSSKRDFRTIFNVNPKIHGQIYNIGSYYYSKNGKTTSSYTDTSLNLGVDGEAPLHISQSINGAPYKNGSTHWVKSGDELTVTVRQRDAHSGNKYQYLRALGNGNTSTAGTTTDIMARSRHDFSQGTTHHIKQVTSNDFDIKSTRRTESSTTYRTVEWKVNPKKHGQVYTVQKYYQDNVNNNSGYSNVGTIKVDDNAPTHNASSITGAYVKGNDYWVKPNDTVSVGLRQHDAHSGNYRQYIRLFGSNQDVRFSHLFSEGSTQMARVNASFDNNTHVSVDSARRNENNAYGRVFWDVTPKTHGHSYDVMYYYQDNVRNTTTSSLPDNYGDTGRTIRVDGKAPVINSTKASNGARVELTDNDSGFKRSRYAWTRTTNTPSEAEWSNWSTSSVYIARNTESGLWYLHVQAEDNVGNSTKSNAGSYTFNSPPVANFVASPTPTDRLTDIQFTDKSTDPDGDTITHRYEFRKKGTTNWTSISSRQNPTHRFYDIGTFEIRLTVRDPHGESDSIIKEVVINNLSPIAEFSPTPSETDRTRRVSLVNNSSDPERDSLTYFWEQRKKGTTNWTNIGTNLSPTIQFTDVGTFQIRLTVTDKHGATDSIIKEVKINNLSPKADFVANPNPSIFKESVTFTNRSKDPDEDTLSHKYEFRKKGTTKWNHMSNSASPVYTMSEIGVYEIRLTVTDTHGATDSIIKEIIVNGVPKADFVANPNPTDRLTDVKYTNKSSDPDNHALTNRWAYREKGKTDWTHISSQNEPTQRFYNVGTFEVRLTVTDIYGATDSIIKEVVVNNLKPKAEFTATPNPTDRYTRIRLSGNPSDPERDKITTKYEYRRVGTTTWTHLSNEVYTMTTLPVGTWEIKFTVTDEYGASDHQIQRIVITNEPPVADFVANPNPSDRLTNVKFTDKSTDPENDKIVTHKYEYRIKGTSKWINLSSNANPSYKFKDVATYQIRLTVTDEYGATDSVIKEVVINNIAPEITLSYSPNELYEGDSVTLSMVAKDDVDNIDIELFMKKGNGQWESIYTKSNAEYNKTYTHKVHNLEPVIYEFKAIVTDTFGEQNSGETGHVTFKVIPLIIKGEVLHTEEWKKIHEQLGNSHDKFYSGEMFLLKSNVTKYPIVNVQYRFIGKDIKDIPILINRGLTKTSESQNLKVFEGTLYEEFMSDPLNRLKNDTMYFVFRAEWANGIIKEDIVHVEIIDHAFRPYNLHRSN